jgi:hypothetical protein
MRPGYSELLYSVNRRQASCVLRGLLFYCRELLFGSYVLSRRHQTIAVRDEATSSVVSHREQRVGFDFHSPTFQVEKWSSCFTPNTKNVFSNPYANCYLLLEHSHVTLLVSSVKHPGFAVRCILRNEAGPFTSNFKLRKAQVNRSHHKTFSGGSRSMPSLVTILVSQ